jgi:outer membrane protein OmpA-like peptidoglycan-associated protein/tetratricopeptide (TPR) repeat protein
MKQITTLLALALSLGVFAQDVAFKKGNFKDDKEGFEAAKKNIEDGDVLLEKGEQKVLGMVNAFEEFEEALAFYLPAQEFNPNNSDLNRKVGHAYLYTNTPYLAMPYLKKSLELGGEDSEPFVHFLLGKAYQLERDFEKAERSFKKYGTLENPKKLEVYKKLNRKHMKECMSGAEIFGIKTRVWVDNVKELNSQQDEIAPSITADGSEIIFNSNKTGNFDIYTANRVKRRWVRLLSVNSLNTEGDDVSSSLAYDGQRLLLFKDTDGQSDIYESKLNGTTWGEPKLKMSKVVNIEGNETFASYDPQDIKVYFVSDGGFGGDQNINFSGKKDMEEKFWGQSQSAGQEINTGFQEGSVYMAPDGNTMYFCSQGHSSIGGYDVFVSYRDEELGLWGKPINMGYPINTPFDELYFSISANGKKAYFASNRGGGAGGMDIYCATFWGEPKQPTVASEDNLIASIASPIEDTYTPETVEVTVANSLTVFKGRILDGLLQEPVEAEIKIFDNSTGEVYAVMRSNSATGKFLLSLPSGLNYGISVEAEGYLFHSENFNLPKGSAYNMINKDIQLKNIDIGSKIALRNVFFDTGRAEVKIDSYPELDRLIQLMTDVPSLKIELSGHTDNVGGKAANESLSQRRADAVRQYLVSRSVDGNRVTAKGYGSSRPVDSNATKEGRANNRRTEFEITAN